MCQTYTVGPSIIEEHARRIRLAVHLDADWIDLDRVSMLAAREMDWEEQEAALEKMSERYDAIVGQELAKLPDEIQNKVAVQINMIELRASKVGH